ncbi:hypothetical protein [Psychrobacillus glaciei]|nr:hypothetical protein [Psychrobacillus glaciei]
MTITLSINYIQAPDSVVLMENKRAIIKSIHLIYDENIIIIGFPKTLFD